MSDNHGPTVLHDGMPTAAQVEALLASEFYQELADYFGRHGKTPRSYGLKWGADPMQSWSRRWEYPFAAGRTKEFAASLGRPARILNAGCGVTALPYYLAERIGAATLCVDSDASCGRAYQRMNATSGRSEVSFRTGRLQSLPAADGSMDVVQCISVLEHTGDHEAGLSEFARVVAPGGLLVLTFDISLDGRTQIPPAGARALLEAVARRFDLAPTLIAELDRLEKAGSEDLLTTDAVRRSQPGLLPWRYPRLKSLYDWLHGRGWTGGFFSLTCFCLAVRRRT
jgi:SAM-dependent methyltransferase